MEWYPVLVLLDTMMVLIVGSSTEKNSKPYITAVDKTHVSPIAVTNLGRLPYQDGEVILFQNQLKLADIFFTPFPEVEPKLTECGDNEFSGRTELTLVVSLYTTKLFESIKHHIKRQYNICPTENCGISLLPVQSIRLMQKGLQKPEAKKKYTLNSDWQSNTQLRQTVQFIIYTSNMSTCKSLQNSISSSCRLSQFELQYSLSGQQTEVRTIEVITEHVANTSMSKQMKSQLHSTKQEIIALTENDYKKLLSETMDQITMNLRAEEGFESIQNSTEIEQLLESELRYMQVPLTQVNDQVWQLLYWAPNVTRPDRLSQVLNKLVKQDSTDCDKFRFEYSQADEAMKKNLKLHDRQNFDNFVKHLEEQAEKAANASGDQNHVGYQLNGSFFGIASQSKEIDADEEDKRSDDLIHYKMDMGRSNGTNNEKKNGIPIILERKDAEKLVRYFSKHVEIQDDTLQPKSMEVILVKVGFLKANKKLFSNAIHVSTRMHLNIVPLRCPYEYRNQSLKNNDLAGKYDRLLKMIKNVTNTVDTKYARLLAATEAKYDRLLNVVSNLTNIVDVKYNHLLNTVDARYNNLSTVFEGKYNRLSITVDSRYNHLSSAFYDKYNRLSAAAEAKYDRLLNVVSELTNTVDAKYGRLLNIINNLTNVDKKGEQSTNASIHRIVVKISPTQIGILILSSVLCEG